VSSAAEGRSGVLLAVGETMALVAPAHGGAVETGHEFLVDAGGAESNVAAHVAELGHAARWASRLGDDALGRRILRQLAERGVDATAVVLDPDRPTGLYVKDPGRGVVYYRRGSAASALSEADGDAVDLGGVDVLHVSGITLALSPTAAAFLDRLLARARAAGVRVSVDVNHRPALWAPGAAPDALDALARRADVLFTGRDEAEALWGTASADDIRARFAGVPELVVKDAEHGATAWCGDEQAFRPSLPVEVVDAVGAGDAFAGGYLAALLDGAGLADRLDAGHARAALTLVTHGDSVGVPAGPPAPLPADPSAPLTAPAPGRTSA